MEEGILVGAFVFVLNGEVEGCTDGNPEGLEVVGVIVGESVG